MGYLSKSIAVKIIIKASINSNIASILKGTNNDFGTGGLVVASSNLVAPTINKKRGFAFNAKPLFFIYSGQK